MLLLRARLDGLRAERTEHAHWRLQGTGRRIGGKPHVEHSLRTGGQRVGLPEPPAVRSGQSRLFQRGLLRRQDSVSGRVRLRQIQRRLGSQLQDGLHHQSVVARGLQLRVDVESVFPAHKRRQTAKDSSRILGGTWPTRIAVRCPVLRLYAADAVPSVAGGRGQEAKILLEEILKVDND